MDPNSTSDSAINAGPTPPPKDLKTKITESSTEFVNNNYESFLRRLMGLFYTLFKFLRESIISMIGQLFGKDWRAWWNYPLRLRSHLMEKKELARGLFYTAAFSIAAALGIYVFGDASRRLTASALIPEPTRTAESTRTPEATPTPRPTATLNSTEVVISRATESYSLRVRIIHGQ